MNYLHVEIQRLRDQLEEKEREIASLRAELIGPPPALPDWLPDLTPTEQTLLRLLIKNDRVTERKFLIALDRVDRGPDLYPQYTLRLRRKLARVGIKIQTKWGEGHSISIEDKTRLSENAHRPAILLRYPVGQPK
jgi:hypothetical protein